MKVILAGIGGWGNTWIKAILKSPLVEIAALVEVDEVIIRQQVKRYDFDPEMIFASLLEAIKAASTDGVIIVTPPKFHHEMSIAALELGIPVLSEKPLADSFEGAESILHAAGKTGVLHMVAQDYRYQSPVQTAKQVLDSGILGDLSMVEVRFFKGPHLSGFHQHLRYPLLLDMSIHHFDLMRYFLDANPLSVGGSSWNPGWSWYENDASAVLVFEFSNGVVCSYLGSWTSTGQLTPWTGNWRFEGEFGVLLLENDEVFLQARKKRIKNIGYLEYGNKKLKPVEPVKMRLSGQDYLLDEFRQAVEEGKPPVTTCQDNIHSIRMVFNAVSAVEKGQRTHF